MTARRHLHSVPTPAPDAWLVAMEEPWRDVADAVDELVAGVDEFDAWLDAELARGRAWIAEMRGDAS